MELRPETQNGLVPSIPELVSELRVTFLTRDFDRVEHALLKRESMLKSHIVDKDREIGSLNEKIEIARLDRINVEFELKRFKDEKHVKKEENEGFDFSVGNVCEKCKKCSELKRELDDEKSFVAELMKRNGELEGEKVVHLEEKKKWVGEKGAIDGLREENKRLEDEKRRAEAAVERWRRKFSELGERVEKLENGAVNGKLMVDGGGGGIIVKKEMGGIDDDGLGKLVPIIASKDGLGNSARVRSGMGAVIEILDSDEDDCNSQGTLQRKEITPQIMADNEPGAVQPEKLAIPSPRGVGININLLNGLASDSSSSSSRSSSSSLDMDNLPLSSIASRKRMRTDPRSPT